MAGAKGMWCLPPYRTTWGAVIEEAWEAARLGLKAQLHPLPALSMPLYLSKTQPLHCKNETVSSSQGYYASLKRYRMIMANDCENRQGKSVAPCSFWTNYKGKWHLWDMEVRQQPPRPSDPNIISDGTNGHFTSPPNGMNWEAHSVICAIILAKQYLPWNLSTREDQTHLKLRDILQNN